MIRLDTDRAKEFGFTSDKFEGWLWRQGDIVSISFIISKQPGRGNFLHMMRTIMGKGYTIHVPTPSARMRMICEKLGATQKIIEDKMMGPVEIMEIQPIKQEVT